MIFERIKELRENLGFRRQNDFAKEMNIPLRTYQTYEQGKVKGIPHTFIEKLNQKYGISLIWLFKGEGYMYENDQENMTDSSIIKEINSSLQVLPRKKQEYYYHKIKADLLEECKKED